MPYDRSLGEVFSAHADTLKDEFRKVLPATVTAVNPVLQTVDVVLGLENPLFDEYGGVSYEVLPPLSGIPLGCLRANGYIIWLPVTTGDTVLLLFSDLSLDTWLAGTGAATQPGWVGKHTIDSAIAIPLIVPTAKVSPTPTTDPTKLIIGKDGSPAQIKIGAADIELGALATDAVALASLVDSAVSTIVTAFNLHVHTGVTTGPGSSGPPGTPIVAPGSTASLIVKAQ